MHQAQRSRLYKVQILDGGLAHKTQTSKCAQHVILESFGLVEG